MDKVYKMSEKEIKKTEMMSQLAEKQITQRMAAEHLGISIRQVKRLWNKYQKQGAEGLINKSRGKPSHNQLDDELKKKVVNLILERYRDFGPTLATEKLAELHGIKISDESVRKIMIAEGLWKHRRKRKLRVFQMRERRACFGELIQIDGSDYDWFEGRSPRCTLLVFVDDATGKLVELWFVPHESFFGYCEAARHYFERYGKPGAFYSDKHGIFHINHPNATSGDGMTDFGRAMNDLGIEIICANTPQAKGRVERANKTLQDRLTKELRLHNISTPEEANQWLPEFMEDYNNRFATTPRSDANFHLPLSKTDNLDLILCRKETRTLSKNLTFQYHKTIYQIHVDRPTYAMRNTTVTVLEKPDHEVIVLYNNRSINFDVYYQQQKQAEVVPSKSIDHAMINASKAHTPPPDHPWRKFNLKSNASSKGDILTLSN
ncbi:MAG TPA: ISNCY family transposase [Caldisericia bacterium]|nr:ISNCY family transposase [Caldisericia bacterium]